MRLPATDLGQNNVVKAMTPDLPGGRADNLASVFVSPEIRKKAQSTLVQIISNRLRVHTERPRFARPPYCSHYRRRTLE